MRRFRGLLSEGANFPAPPICKAASRNINPQVPETFGAEMTVIRPLHAGIWVVAFRAGLNVGR